MVLNRSALTTIRERSGHTKTSLADAVGCDRTLIHRFENGERDASPAMVGRLAEALRCPLPALLGPPDDEAAAVA